MMANMTKSANLVCIQVFKNNYLQTAGHLKRKTLASEYIFIYLFVCLSTLAKHQQKTS